jgi:uncharacterized protein YutE (UPF0331/DUF86 family)
MDWLEFISSLAWPLVAAGALLGFRKTLSTWFKRAPTRLKAGPVEVEWEQTVNAAVSELTAGVNQDRAAADAGATGRIEATDQSSPLLVLRLRDVAKASPACAIAEASQVLEEEVVDLLSTSDAPPERPLSSFKALRTLQSKDLVPDDTIHLLEHLGRLRNIAVHAVEPIDTTQALEFLSLADEAVRTIRPVRQRRELELATNEVTHRMEGAEPQ